MSSSQLESVKQQATSLSAEERQDLVRFLLHIGTVQSADSKAQNDDAEREQQRHLAHLTWLKANRETYAGQYVALDGKHLVGHAKTMREARQQAKQQGVNNPFLMRVSSEQEVLPAGF